MHRRAALFVALLGSALASLPAAAAQRSFVASSGSNGNTATGCGFAHPCRTFASAQTVTDSGGEIVALDTADYGLITIDRSLTITANPGIRAMITSSQPNAIAIATAGVKVVLRRLTITGTGGFFGVSMTNGAALSVEDCVISNFINVGVFAHAPASVRVSGSTIRANTGGIMVRGGATLDVSDSVISNNSGTGVFVDSFGSGGTLTSASVADTVVAGNGVGFISYAEGGDTRLAVTHSSASNNDVGVQVQQDNGVALLTIGASTVTGNNVGLKNTSGTLESLGNNVVRQNGTNTMGVVTPFAGR